MTADQEDLLKGLVLLKGRLSNALYDKVFQKLVYDKVEKERGVLGDVLRYVKVEEEDTLLSQYIAVRWGTGGASRKAYIKVLRNQKGIEAKIKEELGEMAND
jgi:hypothetical protein